jgi:hypothetical protein
MSELFFFCAEVMGSRWFGGDLDRYPFHDLKASLFECADLVWII